MSSSERGAQSPVADGVTPFSCIEVYVGPLSPSMSLAILSGIDCIEIVGSPVVSHSLFFANKESSGMTPELVLVEAAGAATSIDLINDSKSGFVLRIHPWRHLPARTSYPGVRRTAFVHWTNGSASPRVPRFRFPHQKRRRATL